MNGFATATANAFRADPLKRVNYTLGLVLGVDEFQQDQFYHAAGRFWHNRLLHGYGTVSGLAVTTPDPADADPEIRVTPGVAVDPCGREICVPATMCVRLTSWLDRHRETFRLLYPTGVTALPLSVILCHRECPDDVVPVPGEPCRTQEDAMQPSRIRDSFELQLALRDDAMWGSLPGANATGLRTFRSTHAQENAVQSFGAILSRVRTTCTGDADAGRAELLDAVRALAEPPGVGSLPDDQEITLLHDQAHDIFREAFRVWITEVRPRLLKQDNGTDACAIDKEECCVLLADIDLPVTSTWAVRGEPFEPLQERRPMLLHTRLLQEWIASGAGRGCGCGETLATLEPVAADTVRLWLHHDEPLTLMTNAIAVSVAGGAFQQPAAVTAVSGNHNVFDVRLSPAPGTGTTIAVRLDLTRIQTATNSATVADTLHCPAGPYIDRHGTQVRAYVVFREDAVWAAFTGGDLSGSHPAPKVIQLSGRPVADTAPGTGNVLTWNGTQWAPAAGSSLGAAAGDLAGTFPGPQVVGLRNRPIADVEPKLNHYLRWNGSAWIPAHAGGFVVAAAGRYAVVGAGHFNVTGAQMVGILPVIGPVYNTLTVRMETLDVGANRTFLFLLHFGEYENPLDVGKTHNYIVHATMHPDATPPYVMSFSAFMAGGIQMRRLPPVSNTSGPLPKARLIIEITRIG